MYVIVCWCARVRGQGVCVCVCLREREIERECVCVRDKLQGYCEDSIGDEKTPYKHTFAILDNMSFHRYNETSAVTRATYGPQQD